MKASLILAGSVGVALLALAARPASVGAQAAGPELVSQCASCHALTRPAAADATVDRLWTRGGPDLWYAGDKFNRDWLAAWLQKPTVIRPGGVMWFKHAKPGEPRDTIDAAAVAKHPAVDAATAAKLADQLMLLKSDGLVPEGAFKPEAANMAMGKLAFSKLRGCVGCHQDVAGGSGGLSGPQLHDAGQRLRADYVLSYMKDPQAFDPHVWMPTLTLSEPDLQRITGYVMSLGKESK